MTRPITHTDKKEFNALATHPLQTYEWGEFREALGTKVKRIGFFENEKLTQTISMTLHPVPHTSWNLGYFPKGQLPNQEMLEELRKIGQQENCIAIQLEPNITMDEGKSKMEKEIVNSQLSIVNSVHPLFTKYSFLLDLTQSEETLLKAMHSKTRYNIRVAEKNTVTVSEENTDEAFEDYMRLTDETTKRQGFYAHSEHYHRTLWKTLGPANDQRQATNDLSLHLFIARYNGIPLTAWIIFELHDTMYYPYGASSDLHRDVMSSNAMMWEVIKWGKEKNLKSFDMWGAADVPDPKPSHPYYGFHRFKQGYGATFTEFLGSYDLVINPLLYQGYKLADKARWAYLKLRR